MCACACVRACVRVCMCVYVCVYLVRGTAAVLASNQPPDDGRQRLGLRQLAASSLLVIQLRIPCARVFMFVCVCVGL